ncbi:MAG: Dinitrogenase iron-molybdenum cofactor [Methanomassiliicoccales archaeon PtaU1.Bin030]|nr:MAG: Dinitrogenase iron-molybdenum cofactor [Methanomassiliicoccales archaeon PtaU1.Bin030]
MKICVSAEGPELSSLIAEEFGHAPYFIIYDSFTHKWEAFPNEAGPSTEGAGMVAAEQVARLEADVVLTGFIGPHGVKKLRSRNIKIIQDEEGTVESSIRKYMKKHGNECVPARTSTRTDFPE